YFADDDKPALTIGDLDKVFWRRVAGAPSAEGAESDSISFSYTIKRRPNRKGSEWQSILRLIKTYTVRKNDYSVEMSLSFENLSAEDLRVELDQAGPTGVTKEDVRADSRKAAYAWLEPSEKESKVEIKLEGRGGGFLWGKGRLDELEPGKENFLGHRTDSETPMLWIGTTNKFFGAMMYLVPTKQGRLDAPSWKAEFYYAAALESAGSRTFLTGVKIPAFALHPKQSRQLKFDIFTGPKKRNIFKDDGGKYFKPLYRDLNYLSTIELKSCFCAFESLSFGMMWLLDVFSMVAFGNYGVAIILLVFLVRLVLHPLSKRSQVSMMKMQKLAPQMQKLKEK
ncbi:MAG: YidC/Oxa1 family insertase periplasmic-domain containing protein, partial [Phycisphaerae bacterium]|nr:YidC/Oxa1 family insertase periplasmic-domain containing protein [Phycisphaerae bacterium]